LNGAKCIKKAIDEAFGLVTTVAPGVPGVADFVWISLKIEMLSEVFRDQP